MVFITSVILIEIHWVLMCLYGGDKYKLYTDQCLIFTVEKLALVLAWIVS